MSLGFNVNNYNNALYQSPLRQDISFGMQNRPPQSITRPSAETQNPSQKSGILGKILMGVALLAAGSIATVIAFKIKGKAHADTDKVAKEAAQAASEAVNKAETSTDGAKKPGLIKRMEEKIHSFFDDVKKGFDEYQPAPETSKTSLGSAQGAGKAKKGKRKKGKQKPNPNPDPNPNPAPAVNPLDALNTGIIAKLTGAESLASSLEKISANLDEVVSATIQSSNDSVKVLNNTALEEWVTKAIGDFSSTVSSSVKKAGFGKKNALDKIDANNWQYCEGFTQSLGKTTSKTKRRIKVSPDEIKVVVNNTKDNKKNVETAEELFKFNKNTDVVEYFTGYKVSAEGIEYSKGLTSEKCAAIPTSITEGYQKLQDGTVKIKRMTQNGVDGTYGMVFEDIQRLTDGTEIYGKTISFSASKPSLYLEGYTKNPDGSFEALKEIDLFKGSYCEGIKRSVDGTRTVQKKIQLDASKHPLAYFEEYCVDTAGVESAKVKIEYEFGTGKPKYYYEDYSCSAADGEKYSSKAEFKDGKWIKV